MKHSRIMLSVLAILAGFFFSMTSFAGVPQMVNYQGTLTDSGGTPVANGNYSIEFKIYDVASGGTALWTEKWDTTTSQVTVVGGNFNVMLGFQSPIPAAFFADHPVTFLGIKVGTDSEMLPRQQITSVGYAFSAGNGVPKGGILMWSGAIADIPAGWALCDGVERTREDGTKVTPPNLTDRFVIGAGNAYIKDATGGSTTIQGVDHTHSILHEHYVSRVNNSTHNGDGRGMSTSGNYSGYTGWWPMTNTQSGAADRSLSQSYLPPYYALAFIMKL